MKTSELIDLIATADPLEGSAAEEWSRSGRRDAELAAIVAGPIESERRLRRRSRLVALVAVALVAGAAAATAATVLGGPAPDRVKQRLAELDRGMPADLRYNADLDHARAVAATTSGALYAAELPDGGYCLEIASAGDQPRGASCLHAAELLSEPIEVNAPIPANDTAPLLIGGRLNDAGLVKLRVRYGGGADRGVTLGLDRYFLIEVPASERSAALDDGVELIGVTSDGSAGAHATVPPLRDDIDAQRDSLQPIFVSTLSDGSDFTRLLGVEGHVNVAGFATLELSYPDGTVIRIPVRGDGTYRYEFPPERQDDFARRFGVLTARDAHGDALATAPVASVAAWRAREP